MILKKDVVRIEGEPRRPVVSEAQTRSTLPPSQAPVQDSRRCADTVLTAREVKTTEVALDALVELGRKSSKFSDLESHLRRCLDAQRRALRGESMTREVMAAACCAS